MITSRATNHSVLTVRVWGVGLIILIASVTPSSFQPLINFSPFYGMVIDIVIVVIGGVGYILASFGLLRFPVRYFIPLSWLLLTQAIVGTINSPFLRTHEALCLLYPISVLLFTPLCALLVLRFADTPPLDFVNVLAYVIAGITIEYSAAVVIGPMLGFRGGVPVAFGGGRISGSLGNAAILHLVLLPALGVFLEYPKKRQFSWWGAAVCIGGLLLTFSRASAAALLLYLTYYFIFSSGGSVFRRIVMIVLSGAVIIGILFLAESTLVSRLTVLEDFSRAQTMQISWEAWQDKPLLGQGYSQMWPWWRRQGELIAGLRRDRTDGLFVYTDYGLSLWHPHNLVLYIGIEMGLAGLFPLLLVATLFARQLFLSSPSRGPVIALLVSAVVDALSGGTFFTFPLITLVWWLFALALLDPSKS